MVLSGKANMADTDGFEFIEYTAPDTHALGKLFETLGFAPVARHRSKDVILYRQGDINFIVNHEPDSFAQAFARVHGPSACAFAMRVKDAARTLERTVALGAKIHQGPIGPMELNIPAIHGIGQSLIYLVDRYGERSIYDVDFIALAGAHTNPGNAGLMHIDHITHNVVQGRMDAWAEFYEKLFGFRENRYFDIHGELSGLRSRVMVSACGKIRIPINEPTDPNSQIQEYLDAYRGEGIQHIALATSNIHATVETLRARGVEFMAVPETYYDAIDRRVPGHGEDLARLRNNQILIDGVPDRSGGILLQIFTKPVIGPIFFEIIQRRQHEGFGEGNFQALFEAMERDQIARGVIKP
jgi:4-hydroxyphenylpyruvate dioxygenase